ncbi:uncharacterized protein LOC108998118 [Juglans regia]|uniref:ATP-dependent DNA helicase n=1 Tax=Juglans regia TaxID=51240 RepID=A0A6P9E3X3_JUGRE|nr:uncharacterized protein LOC108998118 [Juglans regia]
MGKNINLFHLLDGNICFDKDQFKSREIDDELAIEIPKEDIAASKAFNSEQRHVYNSVLGKIFSNRAATFFVNGPSGTRKIFLYNALLAAVRSRKLVALATASSGVAASILPGDFLVSLGDIIALMEVIDASEESIMEEFLNTLTPNGFPPHELLLTINYLIMLLKNINPSEGLCNGTRLICRAFDQNVIDAEIAVGHHS